MRRRHRARTARSLLILATLLIVAGAAGYGASSYFHSSSRSNNNTANNTDQLPPDNKPDSLTCIADLPTKIKFSQKIMVAVYSDQAQELSPILADLGVGGVIAMDEVTKEQIAQLRSTFAIAPIVAVDQEGGTVQRYKGQGVMPGAQMMASNTLDQAYTTYLKDSEYLADIGITTNLAPVVDVESREPSPLPGRMYSGDATIVTAYAGKAIQAMQDAKIQPVIKHFPGMGSATGNTDFMSATTDPLSVLQDRDLNPYRQLARMVPDVMVSNMIVPDLTNNKPAVWSPEAITLLRSLGYETAVIYSDSLTAKAIPGTLEDASVNAWIAGVDMVLIVQTREQMPDLASYVDAISSRGIIGLESGTIDQSVLNNSIQRILSRKNIDPCSIDLAP